MKNIKSLSIRYFNNYIKDYIIITAGAFLIALSINVFLVPMKISTGGVSGLGTVLYYTLSVPMSVTTLILNAVLFVFGFKTLSKTAVVKTVCGILLLSLFLEVTKRFGTYTDDVFIASVFGGILVGIGVGLTVLKGASTGGSDFAGIMLNKAVPHISVPSFILAIDAVIILFSGFIFKDFTLTLYSALSLYIVSKVADTVLVHGDYAKSVFIISKNSSEIADSIITNMQRGVTGIYSKGMYNQNDGIMLMCIVRPKEIPTLLSVVKQTDAEAFTIVSDAREVRGEGFKLN